MAQLASRSFQSSSVVSNPRVLTSYAGVSNTTTDAQKLYHIIRTPTWVLPPRIQAWKTMGQAGDVLSKIQLDDEENFSQETIQKFESDPEFYRDFLKKLEIEVNTGFSVVSSHQLTDALRGGSQ